MEEMIMPITKELLDQLLQEYEKPADLLGDDGVLHQLTKALVERALEGDTDASSRLSETRFTWRPQWQFEKRQHCEDDQKQTRTNCH